MVIITFGEKLQILRKQNGLSQEQLATKLTISRQSVSKWELDSSLPDTENIIQLSKLFHVSIDYLLKDEIEVHENDATMFEEKPQNSEGFLGISNNYLGISLSLMGLFGILIIGILSSIFPVKIFTAIAGDENSTRITSGISAFIEHNNVEWLIVLCVSFVLMGIVIIFYPYMKEKIIMRQPSFEHSLKKSSRKLF